VNAGALRATLGSNAGRTAWGHDLRCNRRDEVRPSFGATSVGGRWQSFSIIGGTISCG
jgi:hypothetical protein